MLSLETEQILCAVRKANDYLLLITYDGGAVAQVSNRAFGGDDQRRQTEYYNVALEMVDGGLLRFVKDSAHELTRRGQLLADSLLAEREAEQAEDDVCTILVAGRPVKVMYRGIQRAKEAQDIFPMPPKLPALMGFVNEAYVGVFSVDDKILEVPWSGTSGRIPWKQGTGKGKLSRRELNCVLKRPGLKAVRKYLAENQGKVEENLLPYPKIPSGADPDTIQEYVALADDPLNEIASDCERDVLSFLLEHRKQRISGGTTAGDIALWRNKRRFYNTRCHVRETFEDLLEKGLLKTQDGIRFDINLDRLNDARRIVDGVPSDEVHMASVPPQIPQTINVVTGGAGSIIAVDGSSISFLQYVQHIEEIRRAIEDAPKDTLPSTAKRTALDIVGGALKDIARGEVKEAAKQIVELGKDVAPVIANTAAYAFFKSLLT